MRTDLRVVPATAGRVRVNAAAGRAAAQIVGLTDATTLRRRIAATMSTWLVRLGGTALLSSAGPDWTRAAPSVLEAALRAHAPGLTVLGAVLPRQPDRPHMMVFGRSLGTLVVAKIDAEPDAIAHEADVLRMLMERPIPAIRTPMVLSAGPLDLGVGTAEAHTMVTAVVARSSSPAFAEALPWLERDLGDRLGDLPRPAGSPDHWVPCHGDLAPWNLRRTPYGLSLFDWEAAGFGPPGFDRAYYEACNAALGKLPWPRCSPEVAAHLGRLISSRPDRGPVDRMILEHIGTAPAEEPS